MMDILRKDRSARREDGTTLVELLVALGLFTVIGGIVLGGILSAFSSARATNERISAIQEIETAQRRIVQDIRSATGLVLDPGGADLSTDLTVEFRRDGAPATVRYRVVEPPLGSDDPARLVREDTGQTLVTILNNDEGTEPLFTYLDSRGDVLDCSGLGGRECLGAARIRITIVREIPGRTPVRSNTEVTIRNIRFLGA